MTYIVYMRRRTQTTESGSKSPKRLEKRIVDHEAKSRILQTGGQKHGRRFSTPNAKAGANTHTRRDVNVQKTRQLPAPALRQSLGTEVDQVDRVRRVTAAEMRTPFPYMGETRGTMSQTKGKAEVKGGRETIKEFEKSPERWEQRSEGPQEERNQTKAWVCRLVGWCRVRGRVRERKCGGVEYDACGKDGMVSIDVVLAPAGIVRHMRAGVRGERNGWVFAADADAHVVDAGSGALLVS
ncbi:hypothetical protein R3P38DRAFT_2788127 [Favolaschia claudopus]|uniref:Uncharacterized protein n=1 Tax=Favolaschia claudopus TaxID=2862362 RepID=A0AAW0ALD7_9AGAR